MPQYTVTPPNPDTIELIYEDGANRESIEITHDSDGSGQLMSWVDRIFADRRRARREAEQEANNAHRCVCDDCKGAGEIPFTRMGSDNMDVDTEYEECETCAGHGYVLMQPWVAKKTHRKPSNPRIRRFNDE